MTSRLAVAPAVPTRLRRARFAVFGTFFSVGFVMATWLVSIPAVQARGSISHGTLGLLLLVLGAGGVLSMQVAGFLSARVGSKAVVIGGFTLDVIGVNLPAHAPSVLTLAVALFLFGLGNGAADVAMNDQAVIVERRYGRPIMSAFHALWSIGGALGSLVGAVTSYLTISLPWSMAIGSLIGVITGAISLPGLLARDPDAVPAVSGPATVEPTDQRSRVGAGGRRASSGLMTKIVLFGGLAFLLMLSEGVVSDWGALHAVQHLGESRASAAFVYGVFATTMTIMRLSVDRVSHRFGPVFVVRFGSLTAAAGIVIVVLSQTYPLTLIGWAAFGFGLAGIVPQLFTAAGNIDPVNPSVTLSRVVGLGYVGILAGPAIIGGLAGLVGLNQAFLFPLLCCAAGVILAGFVKPDTRQARHTAADRSVDGHDADRQQVR